MAEIARDVVQLAEERLWSGEIARGVEPQPQAAFYIDTGPPHDECEAYSNWFMCRFLEQYAEDIRVACPNGAVLRIAPDLLIPETDDPFDYNDYRAFPDSRDGRLRAGSVRPNYVKFEGMRVTDNLDYNWDASLRLIANFPLCISLTAIPLTVEALVDKVATRAELEGEDLEEFTQGEQYKKLAQDMIEAWDRGEIPTKAAQKARFGRGRKNEEWLALRRVLVEARPEAAKSGPRRGNRIR